MWFSFYLYKICDPGGGDGDGCVVCIYMRVVAIANK